MGLSFIYMILYHFLNNQFQHRNLSYYKIGTTKCIATKLLHRTYIYFCSNIKVLTMVKPRNTANTNEL